LPCVISAGEGLSRVTYYDKLNSICPKNGLLFPSVGKSCCRELGAKVEADNARLPRFGLRSGLVKSAIVRACSAPAAIIYL
jgi:hypothetical protein